MIFSQANRNEETINHLGDPRTGLPLMLGQGQRIRELVQDHGDNTFEFRPFGDRDMLNATPHASRIRSDGPTIPDGTSAELAVRAAVAEFERVRDTSSFNAASCS